MLMSRSHPRATKPPSRHQYAVPRTRLTRATTIRRVYAHARSGELEGAPGFDVDAILRAARRWAVEAALARAIVVLDARLRPDRPPALLPWARSFKPRALDRFYMGCYTSSARSYRSTMATLVALERWSDRGRLAGAMLVPQRSYRQARGWSFADHLRRGIRKLRR